MATGDTDAPFQSYIYRWKGFISDGCGGGDDPLAARLRAVQGQQEASQKSAGWLVQNINTRISLSTLSFCLSVGILSVCLFVSVPRGGGVLA